MRLDKHVVFWLSVLAVALVLVASLRDVLLPFAAGAIIAYLLDPWTSRLERHGLGRTASAAVVIGLVALTVATALFFLLPLAAVQLRQLAITLPDDIDRVRAGIEAWASQRLGDRLPAFKAGLERMLADVSQGSAGLAAAIAQAAWSRGLAAFNLVSLLLVTPVVAFYLLRDWTAMLQRLDSWLPRDDAPAIRRIAHGIDAAVGAFVHGQSIICLILASFYAAALSLVGLRYGFIVGIATGILAFVPMIGWALGLMVALLLALGQAWPETGLALAVLAVYVAGMVLDSAVLSPGIVGQKTGLHPVALIFALFVFSALFGFLGVLVAVPVAAALGVVIRFARDRYLESSLYNGDEQGEVDLQAAKGREP